MITLGQAYDVRLTACRRFAGTHPVRYWSIGKNLFGLIRPDLVGFTWIGGDSGVGDRDELMMQNARTGKGGRGDKSEPESSWNLLTSVFLSMSFVLCHTRHALLHHASNMPDRVDAVLKKRARAPRPSLLGMNPGSGEPGYS